MDKSATFVKIDDYRKVLEVVDKLKEQIANARVSFDKVNDLRHQEEELISEWQTHIDHVEERVVDLDKTIFVTESDKE